MTTENTRKINPKKLRLSKWTAVHPVNKEKHFLVTDIQFDEEGEVIECLLEAVFTKRIQSIDWQILRNTEVWQQGWQ